MALKVNLDKVQESVKLQEYLSKTHLKKKKNEGLKGVKA